ncbi:MAG: SH3 domain-containing protein [Candidatus Promineifilaceae bacterium]
MTKRTLFIYAAAGLIILFAALSLPFQVTPVSGEWQNQTVPSRTATPQGGPPTATTPPQPPTPTNSPGGGGGPQPTSPPGPTSTPVPGQPSATPTVAVTLETPVGGYEATAVPCGMPPTVQARGLVNVRFGPGLDYDPIGRLIFLEVREIIGRAEFATWWQIQLPGNEVGWVADQAVTIQGYTGAVPIVAAPPINGATPTPGPVWEPTPEPSCTPVPTTAATVEAAAPATEPPTAVPTATVLTAAEASPTEETVAAAPTESPTSVPEATLTPAPPTSTAVIGSDNTQEPPTNDGSDSAASTSSWILFIGLGLVVVGLASFFLRGKAQEGEK